MNAGDDVGSGFAFAKTTPDDMEDSLMRATWWYHDSEAWKRLQPRAMLRDFGWERSAQKYLEPYVALLAERHLGLTGGRQRVMIIRLLLPSQVTPFRWEDKYALRETRAGMARQPGAMDVERQKRRRHGAATAESGLVHPESRHPQRDLLSAG